MNKKKFNLLLMLKKVKKSKSVSGLAMLNKEKEKIKNIQQSLYKILNTSNFPKDELISSSFMRQTANYQNEIQQKLDTSINRKKYLSTEILNVVQELTKINKQTEVIEKKIDEINELRIESQEKKSEINFINKTSF